MGKYRASPKEFSEEEAREEKIQTVADLSQWNINERERGDDIHGNDKRFIQDSQACGRDKERRQPDREMIIWQAEASQIVFSDSHDSACCAQECTQDQGPGQDQ